MKKNLLLGLMVTLPLLLLGCGKKDSPAAASEATANDSTAVTASQQAAIDSLDKPNPEAIKVADEPASTAQAASAAQ